MKKRNIVIFSLIATLLLLAYTYNSLYKPFAATTKNRAAFNKSAKEYSGPSPALLSEITPFEWDSVYRFPPYYSKDLMAKIIGFYSDDFTESVSENMMQLIFIKDKKVVCSISTYCENVGYYFNLGTIERLNYIELKYKDAPMFDVGTNNNIKTYTLKR